ncbi:MAG: hypothetical protein QOI31_1521 [Solirubrobacterales bacterium]|jgi:hypothetical protein|nr:hypothetical protein [Solirubrobacterales bacterium]
MLRGGLAGLVIAVGLTLAPTAEATTFTVDTKKDLLDANQVDGLCAAGNGKCSVRAATQAANGNPGLDNIVIPAGTYELTQPADDTPSSLEGDLDLDEAVTIDGAGPKDTIIRQTVTDRVISSNATPAGLLPGALVANLTLTGGRLRNGGNMLGSGVRVDDFLFGIDNVTVRDNKILGPGANSFGGGIASLGPATLLVQESKISGNAVNIKDATASGVGGGIFIEGDFAAGSTESVITDSLITDNVTRVKGGGTGTGGGLYARDPISIARAEISGNRADEGGGVTLTQSLESAVINDLTISGNRAARGAGVNVSTDDPVSFTNTTISENKVTKGQGRGGGALYTTFGEIDLTNVTIADNISGKKKAIALKPTGPNFVTVDIRASVVDGPKKDCKGNDHFGIRELNVFGDTSCLPPGLSTNIVADPKLKPLAQNPGAFTFNFYGPTHFPKNGSPVVGFVTTGCPPPAQDQLGTARIGPCDAGAVEDPGA